MDGQSLGLDYTSIEEVRRITAPIADAGGPCTITEGNEFTLDASNSNIPDESVRGLATYEWDLNNDGDFNDVVSSSPIVAVTWSDLVALGIDDGGTYPIALRITNDSRPNTTESSA
ncbi:MAG: hypothetical protein IID44_15660 [Planctomycetes bacterium]|nr:hypothetical protein [Planctomycetota bacterium]